MPRSIDILIPVRNEADNVLPLTKRLHDSLQKAKIKYQLIFVDDHSTDHTVRNLKKLQAKYPVQICTKQGQQGKAFSILEGAQVATSEYLAMIDADLQYPPEVIPEMLEKLLSENLGVVVANRVSTHDSKLRRFVSKSFQFIFGRMLFGLKCDVQSGLKVFRKDIIEYVNISEVSPWTLDIPLLTTAKHLGFDIGEVDIDFGQRIKGESKIQLFKSIREIGGRAIQQKFTIKQPMVVPPHKTTSMLHAGIIHKGRRFITHSTLPHGHSALRTFSRYQKLTISAIGLVILVGALLNFLLTLKLVVAVLSFVYFVDVLFNLFLILRSLHSPPEVAPSLEEIKQLKDADLPVYSILCPLYKEAHILPHFLAAIDKMDWPKDKLDVMLLLEEDDKTTIATAQAMQMPKYVRIVVVPDSQPKTKPKACNYGLSHARGEYLVIYDAEDIPDPLQMKKVYIGFQQVGPHVRCLQAKLNYHNPTQNLLTRFFTAEYSLWFDVILTGLQSINTTIPLGGTSNHFRTKDLIAVQGWDPFNVTEDCDLGVRLFKKGWKTAIVDSVTLEEANSNWHNWLRQRSRWIKGYMQTYLVHMRNPLEFARSNGWHALLFQLIVGGKIAFMLINPVMWLLTISYFALYAYVGPAIETLFPSIVFYMALTSLLFGNFMFIYYYMIGVARREHWGLMKWVYLVPIYWLMVSLAAVIALKQLITNPHYWEKTIHGLHLKTKNINKTLEKETKEFLPHMIAKTIERKTPARFPTATFTHFKKLITKRGMYLSGAILIASGMIGNVLNLGFNAYLGRSLSLEYFGELSVTSSFLYIAGILFGALGTTINYRVGFLEGRFGKEKAIQYWNYARKKTRMIAILASVGWILLTPFLMPFFNSDNVLPFILFAPVWLTGIAASVDRGYMSGAFFFSWLAILSVSEAVIKLLTAIVFVNINAPIWVFVSIPLSIILSFILGRVFLLKTVAKAKALPTTDTAEFSFPKKFFMISLLTGLSTVAFLSIDVLLVKHYLSAETAGQYALVALVGKMIFFLSGLATQFILPFVSRQEGEGKSSGRTLVYSLLATTALTGVGFVTFGLLGPWTLPVIFGARIVPLLGLLPVFCFGMMCFSISRVFVTYYLGKNMYAFSVISSLFTIVLAVGLALFHSTLQETVWVMAVVGVLNLVITAIMHLLSTQIVTIENNFAALVELFTLKYLGKKRRDPDQLRILILNWRDLSHVWSGGAEVYVHEVAKQLVKAGHRVTVFCGNDGHAPRNEMIDGVQMVRRGGFYTVYFWAMVYYVLRFRGLFDVVIDSENGIPFFTPLYVRVPKFLLIHHIHQEVFRQHLRWPFSWVAQMIEGVLMPIAYHNVKVITVSDSSKGAIQKIGLSKRQDITVINPGINRREFKTSRKTKFPSIAYVGRLKPYKNIEVSIRAFARVVAEYPEARFQIAGEGESEKDLRQLVKDLKIGKQVKFLGKISDQKKVEVLAESWLMVQPSMIEGWGITVIEANACGTPVIASNVPGLRDSVVDGNTGLLVEGKNVKAFADSMLKLIEDKPYRKELSHNALEWSREFEWEKNRVKLQETIIMAPELKVTVEKQVAYVKA